MRPPRARTPAGDDPLAALIAELAVHAADTHAVESEALTLKLTRLDREISATRAAGTGGVAPLVGRRQDLRDRAIALAMKQPAMNCCSRATPVTAQRRARRTAGRACRGASG